MLLQLSGNEPLQQENEENEQQICSKNIKKKRNATKCLLKRRITKRRVLLDCDD